MIKGIYRQLAARFQVAGIEVKAGFYGGFDMAVSMNFDLSQGCFIVISLRGNNPILRIRAEKA